MDIDSGDKGGGSSSSEDALDIAFKQLDIRNKSIKIDYQVDILNQYRQFKLEETPWTIDEFCKQHQKIILTKYQNFLKEYVKNKQTGIMLYHQLGSGKTFTSILMAIEKLVTGRGQYQRIFVFCPASIKDSFTAQLDYFVKTFPQVAQYYKFFNFVSYNTIKITKEIPDIENSIIIIDEIHNFANYIYNDSTIGRSMYSLFTKTRNKFVIGLSGTPFINDFFNIVVALALINPKAFKSTLANNRLVVS